MLTALLPGVREIRTPLLVGIAWFACAWLLGGHRIFASDALADFTTTYRLAWLPDGAWLALGSLGLYFVGSLLTHEKLPFHRALSRIRIRLHGPLRSLHHRADHERPPKRFTHATLWRVWRHAKRRGWYWRAQQAYLDAIHGQLPPRLQEGLRKKFFAYCEQGLFPVLENYYTLPSGAAAPRGLYRYRTGDDIEEAEVDALAYALYGHYRDAVIADRTAIEVRIQLNYPSLYSEIDRLKSASSLRYSLTLPLMIVALILTVTWSALLLPLLGAPLWLAYDARKSARTALQKTWSALESEEVTSPVIDELESAREVGSLSDIADQIHYPLLGT